MAVDHYMAMMSRRGYASPARHPRDGCNTDYLDTFRHRYTHTIPWEDAIGPRAEPDLDLHRARTLRDVGRVMERSPERMRQVEWTALIKLREYMLRLETDAKMRRRGWIKQRQRTGSL